MGNKRKKMNIEKIIKTDIAIKNQMVNWFLKYRRKSEIQIDGRECFTLFDKLSQVEQEGYGVLFLKNEIPVLILKGRNENVIICTTRRFIHFENQEVESLYYVDFAGHEGYMSRFNADKTSDAKLGVKSEGAFATFVLSTVSGEKICWEIPTGHAGFAFWNITTKFRIIGRYEIKE